MFQARLANINIHECVGFIFNKAERGWVGKGMKLSRFNRAHVIYTCFPKKLNGGSPIYTSTGN